jgi:hypothetical protein
MSTSVAEALACCLATPRWTTGMCDQFCAAMYGFGFSGYANALVHWNSVPDTWRHPDDPAVPAGMLMFWGEGKGHVAIADGSGSVFSTDISGTGSVSRVPWTLIGQRWGKPYLGWSLPYFQDTEWSGSSMTRIMRDSTNPADIPVSGTDLAAGYVNGSYAWSSAGWGRFPGIPHVTIDVSGARPDADVLDVEPGDATVAGAIRWLPKARAVSGRSDVPVFYCNRSNRLSLVRAAADAGYTVGRDFKLWVATLDGSQTVSDMTGVVAVQYAGSNLTGKHYDQSIVVDDSWKAGDMATVDLTPAAVKAVADAVKSLVYGQVWDQDRTPAPDTAADKKINPNYLTRNILRGAFDHAHTAENAAAANGAALAVLQQSVGQLSTLLTDVSNQITALSGAVTDPSGFLAKLEALVNQITITAHVEGS